MAILSARRRACRYALGASALAIAAFSSSAASAQCTPDPTVADQTTRCDGEQTNGLVVASERTTVQIGSGAVLSSSTTSALLVERQSGTGSSNITTVVTDGAIRGTGQYGVEFRPGVVYSDTLNLTVGASGSVTGTTGIAMTGSAVNPYGYVFLVLDNSGTISGTGGYAIRVAPNVQSYLNIANQGSGVIGAISGVLSGLDNKGTIDGGVNSAIDARITDYGPSATLRNSGTITSSNAAATITGLGYNYTLINSGTISNTGTGIAVDGASINLTNAAGGSIRAGSDGVAIRTGTGGLQLVNAGTIDGNVLIRTPTSYYVANSSVDSTAGTISGDLTFGGGHDTLHAIIKNGALFTGVTGTIDGGAGNDGIVLDVREDTTIATRVAVTGFEYLNIATVADATATLEDGFSWVGQLTLSGSGAVINRTSLVANGYSGLQMGDGYAYRFDFSNLGTITGNYNGTGAAISLYGMTFDNAGSIDIVGNALNAGGSVQFKNSGTITATGDAVVYDWGSFANSGTIRSTAGTALTIQAGGGGSMENSGTIEGANVGVRQSSGTLYNRGLISSAGTAIVPGGTLFNEAGGVIRGGTMAIGPAQGAAGVYGATVINAGTIEGNVNLASNSSYGSGNSFIARAGGILNGNLTLSRTDMLVTDLSTRTASGFTGINGTVTANGANLRYQVTSDAAAIMGSVADFGTVSYEVAKDKTLALSAAAVQTTGLTLAGHGTVNLAADFAIMDGAAISVADPIRLPGDAWDSSDVMIVSQGNITVRRQGSVTYPDYGAGVYLGNSGQFTNKGTISYQNAMSGSNWTPTVISGGSKVVNDGTILLDGATAISGASQVINTGSILEASGGSPSIGISASTVTNTGIVKVTNQAVLASSYNSSIHNSGTLESLSAVAISGYSTTIQNDASGTIRGGNGTAIQIQGGSVVNSGAIIGTVDLGYSPYGGRYYYPSSYIAAGGTLQGDLLFGTGSDVFYQKGGTIGVSGIIDGGDGIDVFGTEYVQTATVAIDAPFVGVRNFEDRLSVASGSGTTLTLTADAPMTRDINVGGDGIIVNRASTTGIVSDYVVANLAAIGRATLTSFVNEGDVGGVSLGTHSFANRGTIGASGVVVWANDTLTFNNAGQILAPASGYAAYLTTAGLSALSATNSGTIDGGLVVGLQFADTATSATANIVNTGTIRSDRHASYVIVSATTGRGTLSLDNQGVIEGGLGALEIANRYDTATNNSLTAITLTNSGTIRTSSDGEVYQTSDADGNLQTYVNPATTILSRSTASVTLNNKAGGLIAADGQHSVAVLSNSALTLTNDGTIRGKGVETDLQHLAGAVQTGDADDYVRNNGTITGSIDLGNGNNRIENYGKIDGDVRFGDGNDSYTQSSNAVLTGTVDGGLGFNTLIFDVAGSGSFAALNYRNFQDLRQIGSGTIEYNDPTTFNSLTVSNGVFRVAENNAITSRGVFTILGGRVVGAAGSTMTATRFDVAKGATFGSAGTVNGEVKVQGVLSPGASPGTMTINGNLTLASGSTTLFEMTPTISDALIVNGKIVIADGAALTLTGARPLTPGVTYNLITASDGISGGFTTIDKASTVLGLIVQTAKSIELRGQFMLRQGANVQAVRVTDYLNGTLAGASVPAAILAAVPSLLDDSGYANAVAMRQLSPEPYASASQIGVEKGLALVSASRNFAMAEGRSDSAPFTFGQVFGAWRSLPGRGDRGTAGADISAHGIVGGIGYGSERASLGAFVGWGSASQHIRELGAVTKADGVIAGVTGALRLGHLAATALVARDGSDADTDRALPGDGKTHGRYDLGSWVYDLRVSYDFDLSSAWTLSPELGATRIEAHRGTVRETTLNSPFGLSVQAAQVNATFVSAALKLAGNQGRTVRPWLSAGVRSQLSGRATTATGGFIDMPNGLLVGDGAARSRTLATVAAGVSVRMSKAAELLVHAGSEFGAESTGQQAGLGVRLRF